MSPVFHISTNPVYRAILWVCTESVSYTPLPLLEPVLNYRVDCDADPHTLLKALQTLEGEDPQLHVNWRDDLGEVHVQLMGEVQLEILQTILQERFGLTVAFSEGGILYKETLTRAVEGIGHYEPLRHHAEVHLLSLIHI